MDYSSLNLSPNSPYRRSTKDANEINNIRESLLEMSPSLNVKPKIDGSVLGAFSHRPQNVSNHPSRSKTIARLQHTRSLRREHASHTRKDGMHIIKGKGR